MNDRNESSENCVGEDAREVSPRTLRGMDWLNFFLADVQTGLGPFLAIYLAEQKWNPQSVGIALTAGRIAGILAQTPAGGLVDRSHAKRTLIAVGVIALAIGALIIAIWPSFWPVLLAQVTIGVTSSVFMPGVAAITLGLVGHKAFDRRLGRNQTFNSAGNVTAAVAMGLIGYFLVNRGIFFFVILMIAPTLLCLRRIDPREIDHDLARGCKPGETGNGKGGKISELLRDRSLVVFLICAVLFHFANAAMLPLLGEMLSHGKGKASMAFMSACVVVTQLVITLIASFCGRYAAAHGRKTLLLIAFTALPIRGLLYTVTHSVPWLISFQILDGVGAGIFGVVSVLVIADLTRGTGRFNLAQGAIATAVGIGASLSQVIAGSIVHHFSYRAAFLFLAIVAGIGLAALATMMPETGTAESKASEADELSNQQLDTPGRIIT